MNLAKWIRIITWIRDNIDKIYLLVQVSVAAFFAIKSSIIPLSIDQKLDMITLILFLLIFDFLFLVLHSITSLKKKVESISKGNLDDIIKCRNDFPLPLELLKKAKKDFFISGSCLVTIFVDETVIHEALARGIQIKMLMWNPYNEPLLESLLDFDASSREIMEKELQTTLSKFASIKAKWKDQIELRFINSNCTTDFVGIDRTGLSGEIKVQQRLFKKSASKFPNIWIRKKDAPKLYSIYNEQIEIVWKNSIPHDLFLFFDESSI